MKYKKIMFMLVLVVFLLSIAGVSASEIGDTIASENANTIELSTDNDIIEDNLQTSEENEALASTDYDEAIAQTDTEVLGADSATYSDLAKEIRHSGNITLTHKNYTYDWGGTIFISEDNKVIDGNGAVIDMNGSTIMAFYITGSDVTIKNLTIINANYDGGDGGAIYFSNSATSGTVTNCNFINNKATRDYARGGAVWIYSGTVSNCNFVDNKAAGDHSYGGAVCMYSGTVENCNFVNNTATDSDGGAIWIGFGTVTNCNFTNNAAFGDGGAVYFNGNGEVTNCNFTGNTADNGGAIYFSSSATSGIVSNCNFTDNSANYGGAVSFVNTGNVTNCNFVNNNASQWGGAIRFSGTGTVSNCNFTDNTAYHGGAVYFLNNGNVTNCNFVNNSATGEVSWGGAIRMNSGTVTNCNFTNNSAQYGGAVLFVNNGNVTNCNFVDNKATEGYSYGGAVWIYSGTVSNCNFVNNTAPNGGAVYFNGMGDVSNCNFTDNSATLNGGAIRMSSGSVENCNFTNNSASRGGAVYFLSTGNVSNCNFADNSASSEGGAIRFGGSGTVTNCNFADNSASRGGAIYSVKLYTTADTCIFKRNSGDNVNTVIYPPTLNVNNFTTVYGSGDKLTFDLKTNSSIPVTNGNISISVYFKDNGVWVRNYTCLSGEGWIPDLPVGSYIAVFNTEYAEFQRINRTVTINKANSTIALDNIVLDYGESANVTVTTTGATGITAKIDGNDVTVINNYDIQVSGLKAGNYTLTVTTIPDDDHNPVTATSKITVNKVESTLTVDDIVFDYGSEGSGNVSFAGASEVIANVVSQPSAVVSVNGKKITVSGLAAGTYTLNVTTVPDENHTAVTETATITVNKVNSSLTLDDVELDYGESINVTVSCEGATGIDAKINGADVSCDNFVIQISDLNAGNHTLTVATVPDENHTAVTKTATVTVNKVSTNLTAAGVTATYKVNKYLVIKLTDGQGNPLANSTVTVDLNGAKNYTTDENGQIKIKVSNMVPKTYSAKISYAGNDNYIGSNGTAKVVVKKATPKITASAKTFKTATKTKKYTITLKDNTGKAIKNAKVTLKVNGKTYKATTNSKGKATFKITKLTKKGTFKATITYTGNKYYNKVTKKANIKVISSWKTISKGSKDKSTVREIQQALKNHGYYLTAYGHYLMVDGVYADCTVRSVKEFQHDKGLKVTGKVDENTAKKLGLI